MVKGDIDGDRVVTLSEAYRYVSKMVPDATNQNQHPVMKLGEIRRPDYFGSIEIAFSKN